MPISGTELNSLATELIATNAIDARLVQSKSDHWQSVCAATDYLPTAYVQSNFEYQSAYAQQNLDALHDITLVFLRDDKPIALWPLSIAVQSGQHRLCAAGGAVLPPIFAEYVSSKARKRIVSQCYLFGEGICRSLNISSWESHEYFANQAVGLSAWHQQGMASGANPTIKHDLYADLSIGITAYKSKLRKSYKSLVSSGSKLWRVGIMTASDEALWAEFRALHLREAGRVTRADVTWEMQYDAIKNGNAMLVHLHDEKNELVGGGYFSFSAQEASYDVAAYARALFDKPLGHVVQFHAVAEMMRRNLLWYRIGLRPFSGTMPNVTDKESAIGHFKQGFSTHLLPRYILEHEVHRGPANH